MKRTFRTALVVSALASAACQAVPPDPGAPESAARSVMAFELASLDGGTVSPGDAGEVLTLVDFWATWCGPCHLQADILAKLYPELKEKGVQFLAVSLGEPEAVVRKFVDKRPFAYPVLVDPSDTVAGKYSLFVLPTVALLDRDGTVLYLHEGISTASRLRSVVDEILRGGRSRSAGVQPAEGLRPAS